MTGTTPKPPTLFQKLGGAGPIKAVVGEMYQRLLVDQQTSPFFEKINMGALKHHQVEFMKVAFTAIPEGLDVPAMLTEKHLALFEAGLNEKHFDVVAGHFVASCQHLEVPQELIDEAVSVIGPLRKVFADGARKYGPKNSGCQCM